MLSSSGVGIASEVHVVLVMEELGEHLCRGEGMLGRECFRGAEGLRVEHPVRQAWPTSTPPPGFEEDPVLAQLFACLGPETVAWARAGARQPRASER